MAGRFSREYRPTEFVKLPFEDIMKAMAMREQQYQEGYLTPLAYQTQQSAIETRDVDRAYANQKIQESINDVHKLAKDVYGGDYGAAANAIKSSLAKSASDPFWQFNKSVVEDWKKDKDLLRGMQAQGKQTVTFDRGRLDTPYYNPTTGEINSSLNTKIESKLPWDEDAKKVWASTLQHEQFSNEESLKKAISRGMIDVGNERYAAQKTSAFSGISGKQYEHDKPSAWEQFKASDSFDQWKRALLNSKEYGISGLTDEQAEKEIKNKFESIGKGLVLENWSSSYQNIHGGTKGTGAGNNNDITGGLSPIVNEETRPKVNTEIDTARKDAKNKAIQFFASTMDTTNKSTGNSLVEKQKKVREIYNQQLEEYHKKYSESDNLIKNLLSKQNELSNSLSSLRANRNTIGSNSVLLNQSKEAENKLINDLAVIKNQLSKANIANQQLVEPNENEIADKYFKKEKDNFASKTLNTSAKTLFKTTSSGYNTLGLGKDAEALYNAYIAQGKGNTSVEKFIDDYYDIQENKNSSLAQLYYYNSNDLDKAFVKAIGATTGNGFKVKSYETNDDGILKDKGEVPFSLIQNYSNNSQKASKDGTGKYQVMFMPNSKTGTLDMRIGKFTYSIDKRSLPINFRSSFKGIEEANNIFNSYSYKDPNIKTVPQEVNTPLNIPGLNPGEYAKVTIEPGNNNVLIKVYNRKGEIIGVDPSKTYSDIISSYMSNLLATGINQDDLGIKAK